MVTLAAVAVLAWAGWCTRPFWTTGPVAFGVTVPAEVQPVIQNDIQSGRLPLARGQEFAWADYFRYLTFQKKPAVVSPLALTFEGTPRQVTVGDGRNQFEYVQQNGTWELYRHQSGRLELMAASFPQ